jgi:hypothetical protein
MRCLLERVFSPRMSRREVPSLEMRILNADNQSACPKRTQKGVDEIEVARLELVSSAPGRVRAGDDSHAEKAELGFAESR